MDKFAERFEYKLWTGYLAINNARGFSLESQSFVDADLQAAVLYTGPKVRNLEHRLEIGSEFQSIETKVLNELSPFLNRLHLTIATGSAFYRVQGAVKRLFIENFPSCFPLCDNLILDSGRTELMLRNDEDLLLFSQFFSRFPALKTLHVRNGLVPLFKHLPNPDLLADLTLINCKAEPNIT